MGHFDPCEACGRSDVLVQGGLCFECNRSADRAAFGSRPFQMAESTTWEDGRIKTVLARTPRPLPDLEED